MHYINGDELNQVSLAMIHLLSSSLPPLRQRVLLAVLEVQDQEDLLSQISRHISLEVQAQEGTSQ